VTNLVLLLRELEYGSDPKLLTSSLSTLRQRINSLLLKIKLCDNTQDAQDYFALLDVMQSLMMKVYFIKGLEVPTDLWRFAKDFDRIDDENTQHYLFNEIKSGRYSLIEVHDQTNS